VTDIPDTVSPAPFVGHIPATNGLQPENRSWEPSPDYKIQNKGITPIFFIEQVKDYSRLLLDDEGNRVPVMKDIELVRITSAGDTLSEACVPVDDKIKERFDEEYTFWKQSKEQAVRGTPITDWPPIGVNQAKEMECCNIFTVEDLAALADANLYCIPYGRALREKAIAWLRDKENGDGLMKAAAENAELMRRMSAMELELSRHRKNAKKDPVLSAKISAGVRRSLAAKKAALEATPAVEKIDG
jgi:hypothetical protein